METFYIYQFEMNMLNNSLVNMLNDDVQVRFNHIWLQVLAAKANKLPLDLDSSVSEL